MHTRHLKHDIKFIRTQANESFGVYEWAQIGTLALFLIRHWYKVLDIL